MNVQGIINTQLLPLIMYNLTGKKIRSITLLKFLSSWI